MNSPTKLSFTILILTTTAAIVIAVPVEPNTDGGNGSHAKVVTGICRVVQDTSLCHKTLKNIPIDDPIQLIRSLASTAETGVKNGLKFLAGIKPKYNDKEFAINGCEKNLNYALEDFSDYRKLAGTDLTNMAKNYFTCKQKIISIFGYHSTCLDDMNDINKNLKEEIENGIGEGKNLTGVTLDVYTNLNDIFKGFGIKVKLNEQETDPLQPAPISDYYY